MEHPELSNNVVEEFVFPFDYCLTLNMTAGSGREAEAQILKTRRNQIFSLSRSNLDDLYQRVQFSRLKYSFFFPMLYVQTHTVKVANKRLLDFTIRRYIKKLALFDANFHFCYDIISLKGINARVNLFVLPSGDGKAIVNEIPYSTCPVSTVLPLEQILINLVHDVSKDTIVSLWVDEQYVMFMATRGKEILSRYAYSLESDSRRAVQWLVENNHIQQYIENVKKQSPNNKISLLVWGEFYPEFVRVLEEHDELYIDKKLEKKIGKKLNWKNYFGGYLRSRRVNPNAVVSRLLRDNPDAKIDEKKDKKKRKSLLSKEVCREALFSNPSLYGLAISKQSQSLISLDYKHRYKRLYRSRTAVFLCVGIAAILGALSFQNATDANKLQAQISQQAASVERDIERVRMTMPNSAVIDNLVIKANMKEVLRSELNVANFLGWLTNISPDGAVINSLDIEVTAPTKGKPNQKVRIRQAGDRQYQVQLKMQLKQAYANSISQIDAFVASVNKRINSPISKFVHISEDKKNPTELELKFIIESGQFL